MIELNIPRVYKNVVTSRARLMGVETADVNSRSTEVMLAMAFGELMSGGRKRIVVCVPIEKNTKYLLDTWTDGTKVKKRGSLYRHGTNELWVVVTREPKADSVHGRIDSLYVVDASLFSVNPIEVLKLTADTNVKVAGVFSPRGTWFYNFCRTDNVETHRLDFVTLKKSFKELEPLPEHDPRRERMMDLKDVEIKLSFTPFSVFSRNRLKVRTDKSTTFLSPAQQAEAEAQCGPGWATGRFGIPIVSFEVSPLQKRYLAMKRLAVQQGKKPWFLLLKYRRGGFTTLEQGGSYQIAVENPNSFVATLAHTSASTSRIFRIARLYHEKDPKSPSRIDDDSASKIELTNGSLFFIGTAGGQGFARGDTLQKCHGSEVAKWCRGPRQMSKVEDLVAGLMGAASNGEIVLETTPDGREWFCSMYEEAKRGLNQFTPLFLAWYMDPANTLRPGQFDPVEIQETLDEEEIELAARHGLSLAQIAFRREKKKEYKRLFPQEFPEDDVTCFLTSGTCFFDVEFIMNLKKRLPPVVKTHVSGGYQVIVEEPIKGEEYVAGVDTSEGLPGCDPNGVGVLAKRTGKQVAFVHGRFNPRVLAEHSVRLCRKYNEALLGVERENHGHAVLQKVADLGYGRPHFRGGPLYYFGESKAESMEEVYKKARAGWSTNGESRPVMLDELCSAVEDGSMKVYDEDFLTECLSFRLQENGKFEADPGAHDDTVMKWAVAWQMRGVKRRKPGIMMVEGAL